MKEVLLHINNAIEALHRSNGSPGVISLLEEVQTNLMRQTFGPLISSSHLSGDWTLGPDEPEPWPNTEQPRWTIRATSMD